GSSRVGNTTPTEPDSSVSGSSAVGSSSTGSSVSTSPSGAGVGSSAVVLHAVSVKIDNASSAISTRRVRTYFLPIFLLLSCGIRNIQPSSAYTRNAPNQLVTEPSTILKLRYLTSFAVLNNRHERLLSGHNSP